MWGEVGARQQGEVAVGEHGAGKVMDEGQGLSVEVTKHGVGFPSANEADDIAVDAAAEEGHGTAGAKAAGGDSGGRETEVREGGGRDLQHGGDHFAGDVAPAAVDAGGAERCVERGAVVAEGQDSAD